MKFLIKTTSFLLFGLAAAVPFIATFSKNFLKYVNLQNLSGFLIIYYCIFIFGMGKNKSLNKPGKITVSIVLLFVTQVISGLFAYDADLAMQKVLVELEFIVIFLIINNLTRNTESYEHIFKGLLLGFLMACMVGIFQRLGYKAFYIFSQDELNANAGLIKENSSQLTRIWGTFGNSLTFSEYLAITGSGLYCYYRFFKRKGFIAFGIFILTLFCIILTVGRNALFATIFSFILVEFIYAKGSASSKFISVALAVLTLAVIGALLLSPGIQDNGNPLMTRFSNASQDLKEGRLNLWIKGFQAFSKNIFLGVGPGNLHLALSAEGFPMTSEVITQFEGQHVENYFLTILYTYGIIGFFFCIRIYYYMINYSFVLFKNLKGKVKVLNHGAAILGPSIALIISNITNPALIFDQRIKLLFIFLVVVVNNSYLEFDKIAFFKKENIFKRKRNELKPI